MQRIRRAALKMQMSVRKKTPRKIHARLLSEIILLLYAKKDAYVKREKTATERLFRKVTCRKNCVARPLNTRLIIIQSSTIAAAIFYVPWQTMVVSRLILKVCDIIKWIVCVCFMVTKVFEDDGL